LPAAVLVSIGCSVAFRTAPACPHGADDVLQFADAARETINAGNQQNVAEVQKLQNGAKSLTPSVVVPLHLSVRDRRPRCAALPASAFAEAFAMLSTQAVSEDCVTYDREGDARRRSAPARCLDRRYVDLFHLHHRLAARNRALLSRMGAPPTKAQVLTEIDFEIGDAIQLAATSNFPTLVRLLRMAQLEVAKLQRRPELKE
jgi:hypothetical protein